MEKNYVFFQKSDLKNYAADAFTVRCDDDRFWKVFKNFLRAEGIKRIDPKSPSGGARVLSSPEKESDRDGILGELEGSVKLHAVSRVMLFTHHDCSAYGGFKAFDEDSEKEYAAHVAEHKKAQAIIQDRFPDLRVDTYFADENGIIRTA